MAEGGDPDLERRKRALEAKLATHKAQASSREAGPNRTGGLGGMGQALKISSEFIAAVAVGAAIGWTLDYFAGISPWGLVIFLLLGFVAGILNVMRSAGVVAPSKVAGPGDTVARPRE